MFTRLRLTLEQDEYTALLKCALDELRNPPDQVHFILRQELERRGLLTHPKGADFVREKSQWEPDVHG